ncbi:UbiA prenyltransferase family-domain-containing protein [Lentinula aff. detonsa]|uniref:UbiA prenyltransferase family-domain-containing protein n=1 Tax=Lentinula aff. detonsa TaxID=2804958 RepID=A0AA38K835_9AGAR|nr:UbiA prenyltransferase family-domain-containing protein [Lentinula aff. detonsa]
MANRSGTIPSLVRVRPTLTIDFIETYGYLSSILDFLWRHFYTCILFTWTDYKTIMLPITVFACATGPVQSISNLVQGLLWIWLHLLLCNVSNQARSGAEDAINRPWRPLPSGRLTVTQAIGLRWSMVCLCMLWSTAYGTEALFATTTLITTTILYDEVGMSKTPFGKNLCNIGGYTSFEFGAVKIMGPENSPDALSITAIILSGAVIFTTIQAQDFPDVQGDAALGRVTLPIYAPEFSRIFTFLAITMWSSGLGWFWGIGPWCQGIFVATGLFVGLRYYCWRTPQDDKRSYLLFNCWLICAHLLPVKSRMSLPDFEPVGYVQGL